MKKWMENPVARRILSLGLSVCLVLSCLPMAALAEEEPAACVCEAACGEAGNPDCPVCAEDTAQCAGAASELLDDPELIDESEPEPEPEPDQEPEPEPEPELELLEPPCAHGSDPAGCSLCAVQALIDALPDADSITADNAENVIEQMGEIDAAAMLLTEAELAELDFTKFEAAEVRLLELSGQQNPEQLAAYADGISYLDSDGKTQTCASATVVESGTTTWNTGWYVVQGDVTIGTEEAPQRVTVSGDVHLILADGCKLIVNGGIQVEGSNALTLYAQSTAEDTMGKLTTQNVDGGDAAIGGGGGVGAGNGGSGGTITINGGVVQATSEDGAAIGGGFDGGSGGTITINGGVVRAESSRGAAIGGGFSNVVGGSGGEITINGGVVRAESTRGAAIGGGGSGGVGGSGGEITINGGVVRAESTTGAAIGDGGGNGPGGSGGTITISGGVVEAKSNYGAAIGGGNGGVGGSGGEITINGGVVQAESTNGAGIGGGYGGGGENGGSGSFSTGTSGNAVIFASSIADQSGKRNNAWSGIIFEGGSGTVYGDQALTSDMTIAEGEILTVPAGTTLTIQAGVTLTNNGTIENNGTILNNGTINGTITGNQPKDSVKYLDADGTEKTAACTAVTADYLSANNNTLSGGWYVVQGDVTIGTEEAPQRVTVSGDVHLILADRCNLTVNGGIQVQDNSTDSTSNTNALTLYAQSTAEDTMGKLTTQNVNKYNAAIGGDYGGGHGGSGGTITINGGGVQAASLAGAAIGGSYGLGRGGSGGTITISGGVVQATSDEGAAIGGGVGPGGNGGSGGTITISGGGVQAESKYGAAIGGGSGEGQGGSGGTININGGVVQAESKHGAAIGGGHGARDGGSGGEITINGGVVQATSKSGAAIGGGRSGRPGGSCGNSGSFSTGTNGNAVIFASSNADSIADQSKKSSWSGVIFEGGKLNEQTNMIEGGAGKVYGSQNLPLGLPIPENHSLTLDMNSNSLSFAEGMGITLNSGSALTLSGPGSFPYGISVTGGTLAGLLAEGWAYTRDGKYVPVSDEITLSEATSLSRITVKLNTQPADVTMTYGDKASLSVTAEPVTSGDTVTYQWYLDGKEFTGQTQSTLSLSTLNAGTHQIYCAVTCDGFTVNSDTAAVTVNKAASTVKITGDPGKTYDGQSVSMDGKYTTTGTGKVEYKVKGAADTTYTTTAPKNAGDYTVRVTVEADTNHAAASETKDFTITPKTVTLTVTVKNKAFDKTTTAQIDTVTLNGIVEGDEVGVVNGTATFAKSTPGADIPVRFTAFSLTGTDAGNYALTQPTGVTGRILPTVNYLDLTGNADFAKQTEVWINGISYPVETTDGRYANLPASGDLLTTYTYKKGNSNANHVNYPTGMTVYRIHRKASGATLTKIGAFEDLLQYSGCSIRITGKRGIRMITSLTQKNKAALTGSGLAGYTLMEYGTVVQWADTLNGKDLTLKNGKHNYAYKRGTADPVFNATENLVQYTNVLVDFSLAQCKKDLVMRPYIILKGTDGKQVTLYGGAVSRSIGYIAYQNRNVFQPGTAASNYVWEIIHAVYGKTYDKDYKG